MYCVKCGVRLQDGTGSCPLCGTPVRDPDGKDEETREPKNYPDTLPRHHCETNLAAIFFLTALSALVIAVELAVCLKVYGELRWGGFAAGGVALFYIIAVLPFWFRRPLMVVFLPVDFLAAGLFVLYINLATGGHWFLSFAFPVIACAGLLTVGLYCLLKYVRGGRLFILGGFLILVGGYTVLVEFFESVTFHTPMFLWSLFPLAGLFTAGAFLLLGGMIRPLRRTLEKIFFF